MTSLTRPTRTTLSFLLACVALIGLTAFEASASARNQAADASSITFAISFPVKTLDPGLVYDGGGNNFVAYQECDSVLRFGEGLKLEPGSAQTWTQTSPTTYVYNLRSDVKFW